MRKSLLSLILSLWTSIAAAGVPCTLPFNLQNNTIADATQVMANYNALVSCLANAAAAGVNADITQLLGLSSPLGPTFGGTQYFYGGTTTGSATAQVISVGPSSFSIQQGTQVSFNVGFSTTGPTLLNVNSTGNFPLFRHTTQGNWHFVGGEWMAGDRVSVEWDGSQWQWIGPRVIIGHTFDFAGFPCPAGTLQATGVAVTRSVPWDGLFAAINTVWGAGDGVTTFNIPDLRNRATYGQDINTGSGLTLRISTAGGNFDGSTVGNIGGLQNHTMTLGELVAHNHGITDPQHTHVLSQLALNATGGGGVTAGGAANITAFNTMSSSSTGITINNNGSGNPFTVLAPAAIVNKCIQG